MPDYDPNAVIAAYRDNLITKEEAREALGFHTDDDLAAEVIELQVKVAQVEEKLKNAKDHALAEWRRGYGEGYVEGYGDKRAGKVNKLPLPPVAPTWIGYPPPTTVTTPTVAPPWPGRTFTVNGVGVATEMLPSGRVRVQTTP